MPPRIQPETAVMDSRRSLLLQLAEQLARIGLVVGIARVARGRQRQHALELPARILLAMELEIRAPEFEVVIEVVRFELDRLLEVTHRVLHRRPLRHAAEHAVRREALECAETRDLAIPRGAHVIRAPDARVELDRAIHLGLDLAREREPCLRPFLERLPAE